MRWLLSVALLFGSFPLPAAAEEADMVRILVPIENSGSQKLQGQGSEERVGWRRVEMRAMGTAQNTLALARLNLGPDVILENRYTLTGPEDEPFFTQQWGLENSGQTGGTSDADVDAFTAWTVSLGTGVVVAVVDSGIDSSHPDLTGQVAAGWDTVDDDSDPSPVGSGANAAHGTMIAGIIAGAVNGAGVTGLAPDATILDVRACNGGDCWSLDVAEAIYFAVNAGANILNLSFGGPAPNDPPVEAAIAYARTNDVLVIAAAGNDGVNIDSLGGRQIMIPADLPFENIIAVAASDHHDEMAAFSNYGPKSVDLFAPGDTILTAGTAGLPDYVETFGTSFAAAFVSGTAALLLADDPNIGFEEMRARIEGFADQPTGLLGLSDSGRVNAGTVLTKRFIDTSGSVFVNAIDWIEDRGITEGCNPPHNHMYCPSGDVTRGEMAVFFSRAFSLPSTSSDHFSDDEGRFYEGAANRMFEAGITVGCGPDRYCGDRLITREELAAMLARVLALPATSHDYFLDDSGSSFEGAINKIAEAGLTNGCNPPLNDRFCPTDRVTRGEMAAFIKRAVES